MDRIPPRNDEIELSVFGRGYGEAICVHLGGGEWLLVDSCINPESGSPAALTYLASLGLDPERNVSLVVATHWHDDHVQGIGAIVQACKGAAVVCSSALRRSEIITFVVEQERAKGALSSGLDEFRTILRVCRERGQTVIWAKANLPLHPRPPSIPPRVVALSPSEDAFERSLQDLIEAAASARTTIPRRYNAPEGANGASIATFVQNETVGLLLGADLETSVNSETGWDAVISYSRPAFKASAVKIPHHGSVGAHHDAMWSELLQGQALAILTPWVRGAKHLPTDEDLARLKTFSKNVYITALPSRILVRKRPDKMVKRLHGAQISEIRGWGHVRARRSLSEQEWRVELEGDAVSAA
jgi:beta-lactamase superfamily II metal-dependent hydrolase